jgi:hypothetical protein
VRSVLLVLESDSVSGVHGSNSSQPVSRDARDQHLYCHEMMVNRASDGVCLEPGHLEHVTRSNPLFQSDSDSKRHISSTGSSSGDGGSLGYRPTPVPLRTIADVLGSKVCELTLTWRATVYFQTV